VISLWFQCPAKGVTVPYRPKLALAAPVLVAAPGGQTYAVQGQYIIPQSVAPVSQLISHCLQCVSKKFTLLVFTITKSDVDQF